MSERPIGRYVVFFILAAVVLCVSGCSPVRFLDEGETMLHSVSVTSDVKAVKPSALRNYVRQEANSRWFSLVKVPLGIYCLSGTDSTKRANRFFHRIGEAPVVYDAELTEFSRSGLEEALQGKGYLHARVEADTATRRRRTSVTYRMHPGPLYYVDSIRYEFDNDTMAREVRAGLPASLLYKGMPLDVSRLEAERSRLVKSLQERGYYGLHKEFISFSADTLSDEQGVELTLRFALPPGADSVRSYGTFRLGDVRVYENIRPGEETDTTTYRGLTIFYRDRLKMHRRVYSSHVFLRPDSLYRISRVQNTYSALNGLPVVNFSTVRLREAGSGGNLLDCDIHVSHGKPHTVSAELEGTNTAGDLGAAVALTYANRNIFRGAESLSMTFRGAYEAITGLEGYNNQNYIELSAEASLRFPRFMLPFISQRRRQSMKATSEVGLMYDSQNRPEFHRRVVTGTWAYHWNRNDRPELRHRWDLVSLNYVFMPWISETFRENYLEGDDPRYSILRYNYENLFIMRMGYSFVYNSLRNSGMNGLYQTNGYQIRFNVETAGNLLYGMSKLFHARRDNEGRYSLFNIAYSQYAKVDFDYAKSLLIDDRNSLAFHIGFGLAVPYGNSSVIPYEKRYFAGGANSVRGWSVRELGPGSYVGKDGQIDFINQTGNLKLDLSIEYRTFLFWKLHAAAFIDAGNVWNTRDYPDQPGGQFRFDRFYRQIAVSYGLGLRLNFDFFILRFDCGMKAINPAVESGRLHYPIICPDFRRDFTFHFAVGLPF